ncbi:MAG TPA: hypothetical protein VKX28_09370 [Xanthobacteraceae bacterium]|nr:hypothetical protein [Xanthobacteraceae bacterium]
MKRIVITTAVLLATELAAQAYPVAKYYDLIRPHGHPRSNAVHQADLDFCHAQTGQSRYSPDGPAFKKCMLSRGYRFVSQRNVGAGRAAPSYDPGPSYDPTPSPDPSPIVVPDPNAVPTVPSVPMFDSNGNIIPGTGGF